MRVPLPVVPLLRVVVPLLLVLMVQIILVQVTEQLVAMDLRL